MKPYPAYKDSGIEWIGEIPEHWLQSPIKYLFDIKKGKKPNNLFDTNKEESKIYLTMDVLRGNPKQIFYTDEESKSIIEVQENQILVLWDGSNAGEFIEAKKGILSSTMALISPKDSKNNFHWYFFRAFESLLKDNCNGMGIPHVDGYFFRNSNFLLPLPEEQTQIANYLNKKTTQIDSLIAKKENLIQLLEEEKTALINQAVTKGLDPNVKMKESGIEWLGEIPEYWEVKPVKHIADIKGRIGFRGYTVADLVSEGEGAYTIGAKHIDKENKLDLSKPEFISWKKYHESPEIMVKKGDLLLTQRGTLGKVILIDEEIGEATINPSMVLLKKIGVNKNFLYYFFNSSYFKKWIDLNNTATAVPMVSQEQLGNFKITVPPKKEQAMIEKYIKKSLSKISSIKYKVVKEINLLKEYKTTLISEVVTGKVDVRDKVIE